MGKTQFLMQQIKLHEIVYPFGSELTGRIFFYAYGRAALYDALMMIKSSEESNILLPSILCSSILLPFTDLGISFKFYELGEKLEPRIDSINKLIDTKTIAIYYINYFGFPPINIWEIKNLSKVKDLYLIEDNAHGYLSYSNNQPLGQFGDISIFSMRKTVPIICGASLIINNQKLSDNILNKRIYTEKYNYAKLLKKIFRISSEMINFPLKRIHSLNKVISSAEDLERKYSLGIDSYSLWLLNSINKNRILYNRRQDFQMVLKFLTSSYRISPLYEILEEGICPYAFPFVTNEKDKLKIELKTKKIRVSDWPEIPPVVDNKRYLKIKEKLLIILLAY